MKVLMILLNIILGYNIFSFNERSIEVEVEGANISYIDIVYYSEEDIVTIQPYASYLEENEILGVYNEKVKVTDKYLFSGNNCPQSFKIIVELENEEVIISEKIDIIAYHSKVYFNVLENTFEITNIHYSLVGLIIFLIVLLMGAGIFMYIASGNKYQNFIGYVVSSLLINSLYAMLIVNSLFISGPKAYLISLGILSVITYILSLISNNLTIKNASFRKNLGFTSIMLVVTVIITFLFCFIAYAV